jgi:uncharacterized membrane protein
MTVVTLVELLYNVEVLYYKPNQSYPRSSFMSDNNSTAYHVVALEFAGQDRAKQVVELVQKGQKAADLKVQAWVVVEVDGKGKAHVKQTGHGAMGATLGGATGALLSLIGGPAGLLMWLIGGSLLGGLAGKYLGKDFDEDTVKAVAANMEPNSSALLMIVEDKALEAVEDEFGGDGQFYSFTVGSQISGELESVTAIDLGEVGAGDTVE